MGLNDSGNFINKVSQMDEKELETLDLQVQLVSKAKESDDYYFSKKELLDDDLRKWLKGRIKRELNKIKVESEGQSEFYISEYNHELTKPDYIAKLPINQDGDLNTKVEKLFQSLDKSDSDLLDKNVNFQVIKLSKESNAAYFIFYRGVKISAVEKRSVSRISKMTTIRDRNQLVIQNKNIIEFGGRIEIFIFDDNIYILNPRTLEYTFDYDDHIKKQRDENLDRITSMRFFDDYSNKEKFIKNSSQYILSRGLASIKKETLEALEESFEERCEELKSIKENIPEDDAEKQEYLSKFESLWPLYEHIDVENKKVRYDPNQDVTTLLYFFSDKIVESFLTKKIKAGI